MKRRQYLQTPACHGANPAPASDALGPSFGPSGEPTQLTAFVGALAIGEIDEPQ